jgi:voltage-gated potassium channel
LRAICFSSLEKLRQLPPSLAERRVFQSVFRWYFAEGDWMSRLEQVRQRIHSQLEPAAWSSSGLSPLNKLIGAMICIAAIVAILESESTIYRGREAIFAVAEIGFTVIFIAEYAARLWAVGENPTYAALTGRLRYAVTPSALIDLLAILPIFVVFLGSEAFILRIFRLIRILRLARLGRFSTAAKAISTAVSARRYELLMSLAIAGVLLLISSTLLYVVEGEGQPENFGSIPRSMWWSIATLTTVGYGDVYPLTVAGRIFAGITAITGIGLIAMPTGILAAAFSDAIQAQRVEK